MSFTKPQIYNLALSALMLGKEVIDVTTDTSNEVRILNTHYDIAFESTLQDLDLDSTSQEVALELLADLRSDTTAIWYYVYKYPSNCIFMRRIKSGQQTDNRNTHISKRLGVYNTDKAIYTNEATAVIEYVAKDTPLVSLNAMAALALAYKLAYLSAPLLVGKGAKKLREDIERQYVIAKTEAQETDKLENFVYEADDERSEFVRARLE